MSKNYIYKNTKMIPYESVDKNQGFGYFNRVYMKHLKLFNELPKPARDVLIGLLDILEGDVENEQDNEHIREVIGFMPWEGKFNLSQADMSRLFNMSTSDVSTGIKHLLANNILIKHDKLYWLRPAFFSHQKYFNADTLKLFEQVITKDRQNTMSF